MTITILPCRSASLGLRLLFISILLCLLASLPAAAQGDNVTCTSADMGSYAELGFCLPENVVVEPETLDEVNYTAGREVRASLRLNGSEVSLHLLYPCQAPQMELGPAAMRSLLEAYDPAMLQANYSDSNLSIGNRSALWGEVANQIFVAYQPTNRTPALILMDGNMSDALMVGFLADLRITPKEGSSPLPPGYCPDSMVAPAEVNGKGNLSANAEASSQLGETTGESTQTKLMTGREKMAADMQAAKERMAATKKTMLTF
ncbi:Uncharacterised protein [uncultured archaeon]|nr:Uncharacterised protein [uncultured archaeon]